MRFALTRASAICAALALATGAAGADGADGGLDTSFGSGGKVTTDFGHEAQAVALAIQEDGKLVAAGGFGSRFTLARYDTEGSLDRSFGSGGTVTTAFGGFALATAIAIQPDGKIVAVGDEGCCGFALARYNRDGTLDRSFGSGGRVTTDLGGPRRDSAELKAVALQPDGKIVVAGGRGGREFALVRYTKHGRLDTRFGSDGKVFTRFGRDTYDSAAALALQRDGRIVAAGAEYAASRCCSTFAVARYAIDGSLDASFGSGGKVTTGIGPQRRAFADAVAVQEDGRIVVAGSEVERSTVPFVFDVDRFTLARYDDDGSLDTSFGTGGTVTTSFGESTDANATALAVEEGGRLVLAGSVKACGTCAGTPSAFALARYGLDGRLDPAFGSGGTIQTQFDTDSFDVAYALALQKDGKLVAAGSTNITANDSVYDVFALARYVP